MALALLLVAVLVLLYAVSRGRELFVISVRSGQVLVVRGRVPGGFLADVRTIVGRPPVRSATLRAIKGEHHARLAVSGDIDDGRAQRLRNAFGLRPMAQLRTAPVVAKPTLGQILGIAWLAWFLDRR
jgi:hypothetical protein